MKVFQVNKNKKLHVLWTMKYFSKTSANLFLLTCKILQGSKIQKEHKNNIVVHFTSGNIILYCLIKSHNGWVAGVELLCETVPEKAQKVKSLAQQK